jgi:hypothetical protein
MTTEQRDGLGSPFSRWIRAHPQLDSIKQRLSVTDSDYWIHQYRAHSDRVGTRAIDQIMLVELKTFSADLPPSQRDTLHLVSQMLRSASMTSNGKRRYMRLSGTKCGERRIVRCFGVHTLRLSRDRPDNSTSILWDGKVIDEATLVLILQYNRDPDYPQRSISDRRHHTPGKVISLPLWVDEAA